MRNKIAKNLRRLATEETIDEVPVKTQMTIKGRFKSGALCYEPATRGSKKNTNLILITYPERKANYKVKKRAYKRLNRNQRTAFNAS